MPFGDEVAVGHRRHVPLELIAERDVPLRRQKTRDGLKHWHRLVPEMQDVHGHDEDDWRVRREHRRVALQQPQPAGPDGGAVA